jgi:hypothetical protein
VEFLTCWGKELFNPQPLEIRGFFCWIEKKGGGFIYWLVEIFD